MIFGLCRSKQIKLLIVIGETLLNTETSIPFCLPLKYESKFFLQHKNTEIEVNFQRILLHAMS